MISGGLEVNASSVADRQGYAWRGRLGSSFCYHLTAS